MNITQNHQAMLTKSIWNKITAFLLLFFFTLAGNAQILEPVKWTSKIEKKGNKLPDGLGGAREENAAATQRVDTRKSEPIKTKSEAKKSDKKNEVAETEEKTVAKQSSSKKEAEKVLL